MSDVREIQRYFENLMLRARDSKEAMEIANAYQREMEKARMWSAPPQMLYPSSPVGPLGPYLSDMAPEKPKKPLPEEHVVSAITGYRAWNVPLFVDELRSVAKHSKWLPYQRFDAQCESQQCSGVSCQCGIYAFNKMDLVQKEYTQTDRSKRYVYGECWLWGRVLECKDGYRAQFAYPKAFIDNGAIAKRMAEVFGVTLLPTSKQAKGRDPLWPRSKPRLYRK